jgi:hypothetical protein
VRKKNPKKSVHGKNLKINKIQNGRHPTDGNRKTAITNYQIMIESSVTCLLVLASHKAFNGYCVTFVKPSKYKMAAIFDLKLVKNGSKTCSLEYIFLCAMCHAPTVCKAGDDISA